jgi:hypothetical protein
MAWAENGGGGEMWKEQQNSTFGGFHSHKKEVGERESDKKWPQISVSMRDEVWAGE